VVLVLVVDVQRSAQVGGSVVVAGALVVVVGNRSNPQGVMTSSPHSPGAVDGALQLHCPVEFGGTRPLETQLLVFSSQPPLNGTKRHEPVQSGAGGGVVGIGGGGGGQPVWTRTQESAAIAACCSDVGVTQPQPL